MKKLYILIALIIVLVVLFLNIGYKNTKMGNNKSIKEIEDYILNIESYKAKIEIQVKNNRNENLYRASQEVTKQYEKMKMLEPEEISGLEMLYANGKLEIKNTQLNLSKIYEKYSNLSSNNLFLTEFIKFYKENDEKLIKELDENILLLQVKSNKNKYDVVQKLYVNKQNLKPEKLEIYDDNNTAKVYILYNEIEINI